MLATIGLGQAGGNIANLFAEKGVPSLAINYSSKDLETCSHIEHKLKLIGSEGVGKQREEAVRLFHNNYESAITFAKEHLSQPSIEVILVIFSTAGGSGSGISSILSELLINEMPEKTFVICPILPTVSECITAQLNTLDTLTSLSDLDACIVPLDNSKCVLKEGVGRSYKSINEAFVYTILTIFNYTEMHSVNGNFDSRDLRTLLSTKGFISIGECDISQITNEGIQLNEETVVNKIQQSHADSIFTSPSYDQIIRTGLICDVQESLMRYINVSSVLGQFSNQPLDVFEGYHHNEKGRVILIYTGLTFNNNRLSQIEQLATQQIETFQSTLKSTSISVNRPTLNVTNSLSKNKKAISDILNKHKKNTIQK